MPGTLQDWMYSQVGAYTLTIVLSCCKFPEASALPGYWDASNDALVAFAEQVGKVGAGGKLHREQTLTFSFQATAGLAGVAVNVDNQKPVVGAAIWVDDRETPVYTGPQGHFWRPLLPSEDSYNVTATSDGYYDKIIAVEIT